jgi:hypothetical protein
MDLPYRFPDPREEAYRRGCEFRKLSSTERWRQIADLMALGWSMVAASPNRTRIEQHMADQEAEAQRIQRELFRRHGR